MTNYDYILNLIKIQENNLNIKNVEISDEYINIYIEFSSVSDDLFCPSCGSFHLNIHSYWNRKIKHSKIASKNVTIFLKQPRLICMEANCKKTFNHPCSFVNSNRRISNSLLNDISMQISEMNSFKQIAKNNDLTDTTVINEFKNSINEYRCNLSEVLCIDEFKASTIAGTYAFIIGDPISGKILDILPSRKQDYLIYYFQSISREEVSKVKYVVSDLFEAFRSIIQMEFPHAIHIADRFHWIKLSTEAFNKMRIRIMNYHLNLATNGAPHLRSDYIKNANLLKSNYKLLLKNRYSCESWEFDQPVKTDKFGNFITIQDIIEQCLKIDSSLEEGYHLLQDLYRIAKFANFNTARDFLSIWINKIISSKYIMPELQKVALTYNSWKNEIVNSFIINPITHQRLTNGFIEGKNNFVKVIKKIGFGYKDFDIFRNRILNINRNL